MGKYVAFQLGTESYGISIEKVQSIETMLPITRVPTDNQYVKGVINLRGVVIPVIDLRKRLAMPPFEDADRAQIIVLSQGNQTEQVGVIVDAARNVLDIDDEMLQPPANGAGTLLFVQAMAKIDDRILSILDLDGVLNSAN